MMAAGTILVVLFMLMMVVFTLFPIVDGSNSAGPVAQVTLDLGLPLFVLGVAMFLVSSIRTNGRLAAASKYSFTFGSLMMIAGGLVLAFFWSSYNLDFAIVNSALNTVGSMLLSIGFVLAMVGSVGLVIGYSHRSLSFVQRG